MLTLEQISALRDFVSRERVVNEEVMLKLRKLIKGKKTASVQNKRRLEAIEESAVELAVMSDSDVSFSESTTDLTISSAVLPSTSSEVPDGKHWREDNKHVPSKYPLSDQGTFSSVNPSPEQWVFEPLQSIALPSSSPSTELVPVVMEQKYQRTSEVKDTVSERQINTKEQWTFLAFEAIKQRNFALLEAVLQENQVDLDERLRYEEHHSFRNPDFGITVEFVKAGDPEGLSIEALSIFDLLPFYVKQPKQQLAYMKQFIDHGAKIPSGISRIRFMAFALLSATQTKNWCLVDYCIKELNFDLSMRFPGKDSEDEENSCWSISEIFSLGIMIYTGVGMFLKPYIEAGLLDLSKTAHFNVLTSIYQRYPQQVRLEERLETNFPGREPDAPAEGSSTLYFILHESFHSSFDPPNDGLHANIINFFFKLYPRHTLTDKAIHTLYFIAMNRGCEKTFEALTKYFDINTKNSAGQTILSIAASKKEFARYIEPLVILGGSLGQFAVDKTLHTKVQRVRDDLERSAHYKQIQRQLSIKPAEVDKAKALAAETVVATAPQQVQGQLSINSIDVDKALARAPEPAERSCTHYAKIAKNLGLFAIVPAVAATAAVMSLYYQNSSCSGGPGI